MDMFYKTFYGRILHYRQCKLVRLALINLQWHYDNNYNDITYNNFTYNVRAYNTKYGWHYL